MKKSLTMDRLLDALYCTAPTGFLQLCQHLAMRDVQFEVEDLRYHLHTLLKEKTVGTTQVNLAGVQTPVTLYTLPGQER